MDALMSPNNDVRRTERGMHGASFNTRAFDANAQFSDRQRTVLLSVARRALVNSLALCEPREQAVEQATRAALALALDDEPDVLLVHTGLFCHPLAEG